jgi:hypothetical protein
MHTAAAPQVDVRQDIFAGNIPDPVKDIAGVPCSPDFEVSARSWTTMHRNSYIGMQLYLSRGSCLTCHVFDLLGSAAGCLHGKFAISTIGQLQQQQAS